MNDTQRKIQDSKNIDFTKWMNTDRLNDIQCKLKGLKVIQFALQDSDSGQYIDINHVHDVIASSLQSIVDEIEELKPRLNYMNSFARVGTDELVR